MELILKSNEEIDVRRYEETLMDDTVSRTIVFPSGTDTTSISAKLTDDELSSAKLKFRGGNIVFPALTVQSVSRMISEESDSVAASLIEA